MEYFLLAIVFINEGYFATYQAPERFNDEIACEVFQQESEEDFGNGIAEMLGEKITVQYHCLTGEQKMDLLNYLDMLQNRKKQVDFIEV